MHPKHRGANHVTALDPFPRLPSLSTQDNTPRQPPHLLPILLTNNKSGHKGFVNSDTMLYGASVDRIACILECNESGMVVISNVESPVSTTQNKTTNFSNTSNQTAGVLAIKCLCRRSKFLTPWPSHKEEFPPWAP